MQFGAFVLITQESWPCLIQVAQLARLVITGTYFFFVDFQFLVSKKAKHKYKSKEVSILVKDKAVFLTNLIELDLLASDPFDKIWSILL